LLTRGEAGRTRGYVVLREKPLLLLRKLETALGEVDATESAGFAELAAILFAESEIGARIGARLAVWGGARSERRTNDKKRESDDEVLHKSPKKERTGG
jgi:hypothetical protein